MKNIEMTGNHRYYYEDKGKKIYVPAVTTILNVINKPALIPWAVRTTVDYIGQHLDELRATLTAGQADSIFQMARDSADQQKKDAADVGTQVHQAIQAFLKHEAIDIDAMPEQARKSYIAFLDWMDADNIHFDAEKTEYKIHNELDDYCGTVDAVGKMNGKNVILDWKTGSGIYPEAYLQVAAYANALEHIEEAHIVRFGKDNAQFEHIILDKDKLDECYKIFISCLKLYRWLKSNKGE